MPVLKGGLITQDPRLDRIPQFDPQSANYRIRSIVGLEKPVRSYTWSVGDKAKPVHFDQGREGACVEYGFAHELVARPVMVNRTVVQNVIAKHGIYWPAQMIDEWEGGSYPGASPFYEGTSVLAGAKVLTNMGHYSSYHWAFTEKEIALAVGYFGPVVIGINWYTGMFEPNNDGFLSVTGQVEGGHCILVHAIDAKAGFYWLWNSWGADWGVGGRAKLSRTNMSRLLMEAGEACLPQRKRISNA